MRGHNFAKFILNCLKTHNSQFDDLNKFKQTVANACTQFLTDGDPLSKHFIHYFIHTKFDTLC